MRRPPDVFYDRPLGRPFLHDNYPEKIWRRRIPKNVAAFRIICGRGIFLNIFQFQGDHDRDVVNLLLEIRLSVRFLPRRGGRKRTL